MKTEEQDELKRAVDLITRAYESGRIDTLELAAEMQRLAKIARDAVDGVDGFSESPARVVGEVGARIAMGEQQLQYHHAFLDDVLRGILPHDLVLVGAETGAGKTDLVTGIARENARRGKRVYYFALEAEPLEIERRIKFSILCELADRYNAPGREDLNYPDWYLGQCEKIVGRFDREAEDIFEKKLSTLFTYYRGSKFDYSDLSRMFLAIQDKADLVICDHLHYFDLPDDSTENVGYKKTLQVARDLVLGAGVPMILVAHLRKRDSRSRSIVPDIEMFHGSSDIIKICTRAIMLSPARSMPSSNPYTANTFVHVPKDRIGGGTGLVALHEFHRGMRTYASKYRLGRPVPDGTGWEELQPGDRPRWARRAR